MDAGAVLVRRSFRGLTIARVEGRNRQRVAIAPRPRAVLAAGANGQSVAIPRPNPKRSIGMPKNITDSQRQWKHSRDSAAGRNQEERTPKTRFSAKSSRPQSTSRASPRQNQTDRARTCTCQCAGQTSRSRWTPCGASAARGRRSRRFLWSWPYGGRVVGRQDVERHHPFTGRGEAAGAVAGGGPGEVQVGGAVHRCRSAASRGRGSRRSR